MKKIDWQKIKLTKEEQEIEDNAEKFVPLSPQERARMERALAKARKEATISLRMNQEVLDNLKMTAKEEGLPYQTLISSILHKYVRERLFSRYDMITMVRDHGKKKYRT